MKQLFLCERSYPLYRTIVRALQSGDDIDILFSEHVPGLTQMAAPLRESGIFRNVYVYEDPYYAAFQRREEVPYPFARSLWEKATRMVPMLAMKLWAFTRYQRRSRRLRLPDGLDFSAYDEIYVDELPSAAHFYLLHQKELPLICVEHGNGCFQNYKSYFHTRLLNRMDRMHLLYATRGCSRRYAAVEVSENKNLLPELAGKEIRERSMDGMVRRLSPDQREHIFQLYCRGFGLQLDFSKTYDIVLTIPVYYRAAFDERFQLGVTGYIVSQYTQGADMVLLKAHPRDTADYSGMDSRCIVVPGIFPGEVLSLSNSLRIRRVITIISSSIRAYDNAQERIELGMDFIKQFDEEGRRLSPEPT